MVAVSSIAIILLFVAVAMSLYNMFVGLDPMGEGIQDGVLATCLYLFAVHHFFVTGIIWLAVASVVVATLLVIKNVLHT